MLIMSIFLAIEFQTAHLNFRDYLLYGMHVDFPQYILLSFARIIVKLYLWRRPKPSLVLNKFDFSSICARVYIYIYVCVISRYYQCVCTYISKCSRTGALHVCQGLSGLSRTGGVKELFLSEIRRVSGVWTISVARNNTFYAKSSSRFH